MRKSKGIFIPFNEPYFSGKETKYIVRAIKSGKISGGGVFTRKCHEFFKKRYDFNEVFLTTSCTDALEMAAILFDIRPGDEVILPSFTFVSTANAFVLRGARLVFADSEKNTPNLDIDKVEELVTPKTKVIVPVHYAGIACDMGKLMTLAKKKNLLVVEDAAHAIDSFYKGIPLGSIGNLAAFSFHETKNIISGEGGMLVVNDDRFKDRAEIIWEKGTNRAAFFRGEVNKYNWVDVGSSFLPSDIIAAFLYAQLESFNRIQLKRKDIWNRYHKELKPLEQKGYIRLPNIPEYATNNGHLYYILCENLSVRTKLIERLMEKGILAPFHYLSLHKSPFFQEKYDGRVLTNSDRYSDCLLRLPLFYRLTKIQQKFIIDCLNDFFKSSN